MSPARIHFSDHAVNEMRKLRPPVTRQMVRRVLAEGVHDVEIEAGGEVYYRATLSVEHRTFQVIYLKKKAHLLVVTVYEVGKYD